jgi:hypothetical protein
MSKLILIRAASKIAMVTPEGGSFTTTFSKGMTLRSVVAHLVRWLAVAMSREDFIVMLEEWKLEAHDE